MRSPESFSAARCGWVKYAFVLVFLLALHAEAAGPRRVLLLHSFGPDFAPFRHFTAAFRTELARLVSERVVFQEISLNAEHAGLPEDLGPFVEFLRARFGSSRPQLVVTLGAPAAEFYLANRHRLFQEVPLLVAGVEQRLARDIAIGPEDALVGVKIDYPRIVGNILQVLPDTRTIGVVMGSSALERFWLKQLQEELAPLSSRVTLVWLSELTLDELRQRVAALPPHSALLYSWFVVGADGVPHENEQALAVLRAVSSAPLFGAFESQLGEGVVGGPHVAQRAVAVATAQQAQRLLVRSKAAAESRMILDMAVPAFDWRELERWRITESRLPPGSEVRFRRPSLWQQHRTLIAMGAAVLVLQAILIIALFIQHGRRERAERESKALTTRLLTAHEDERRRLARELHDDLSQRLARVAIDAGRIERGGAKEPAAVLAGSLNRELARLSEDVHALSYRLHPSVLDDLGLEEALEAECGRMSGRDDICIGTDIRDVPPGIAPDTALCIFRVAQEALRNVERHARAHAVSVALAPRDGGLQLAVTDDGDGFDPAVMRARPSLGVLGMRERVRLAGGRFGIESRPGKGTTVSAWVPLVLRAEQA